MKDKIKVLEMIADDMKNDAKHYEGQAFNGRNVAEYFGKQGAAIAALADIMKSILEWIWIENRETVIYDKWDNT